MPDEREMLKKGIEETASSLQGKISELSDLTQEKVESFTGGIQRTVETIQTGFENLSLKTHIEKRPLAVVAGVIGVGLLAGLRFARKRRVVTAVARPSLVGMLAVEVASNLVPLAVDLGLRAAKSWSEKRSEPTPAPEKLAYLQTPRFAEVENKMSPI